MKPLRCLLLAAVLGISSPLGAQIVRGRVLDARSFEPVPEVLVSAVTPAGRIAARARTTADGQFTLAPTRGTVFRIHAVRTGYRATISDELSVEPRHALETEILVSTEPLALAPLTITGRVPPRRLRSLDRIGFYRREGSGVGRYIRREDFDPSSTMDINEILLRQPGMTLRRDRQGRGAAVVFSRHRSLGQCLPHVVLNGLPTQPGTTAIELVVPEQVLAIELYPSTAGLPPQFGTRGAACGTVVLWTRTGRDDDTHVTPAPPHTPPSR